MTANLPEKVTEKNVTDLVLNRVIQKQMQGTLQLPTNYSPQNALLSAYLMLQDAQTRDKKPVLEACTQASIANALMEMVVQGLNPTKGQVYFIPYGNQLQMQRSYMGTIAITKRLSGVKDVKGYPVYKGDKFSLGFDVLSGKQTLKEYEPSTARKETDLIGAFAIVIGENEILHTEYMTMDQIRSAWRMGQTKGDSPAHKGFPDQMAVKTVINRACKLFANTSDDSGLISGLINAQTDSEVELEIDENANQELLDDGMPEPEYEHIDEEIVIEEEVAEEQEEQTKAPF